VFHRPLPEPTFYLLTALAQAPSDVLTLAHQVAELSSNSVTLSAASMRATLSRLIHLELVHGYDEWREGNRGHRNLKYYQLTPAGRRELASEAAHLQELATLVSHRLAEFAGPA
jgi:DNA-binding PadR family transcriptional regulator